MQNTTKSGAAKSKDKSAGGTFGRDLARYGLNTSIAKGAIDFIQNTLDEQKKDSEHSRIMHEQILLSAEEFATKSVEHHSGGAYAMRKVQEKRNQPKAEEKKAMKDKGWTRGTRDLNYSSKQNGQSHQDKLNRIEESLAEMQREDQSRREVKLLMNETQRRVESIQRSQLKTMQEYEAYKNKHQQRRGEIGELARSKEIEKSDEDDSDTLSLEEQGGSRFYNMVKERAVQKTSAERRDHLRRKLAAKPKNQSSPPIDTGSMSYDAKVAAMRARDAEQRLSIFGESDEEIKNGKNDASDSDDYEMAQIEEEKRKKIEKAQRRRIEQNPQKWEGTGLESLVKLNALTSDYQIKMKDNGVAQKQQQYRDPVEKRKYKNEASETQPKSQGARQSLFPKSNTQKDEISAKKVFNLDGQVLIDRNFNHMQIRSDQIGDEVTRAGIQHSVSQRMHLKRQTEMARDTRNKIVSSSKFFILKQAQSLPCHHSQNKERLEAQQLQDQGVKIFDRNQNEVTKEHQKSKNLSTFGQQHQAAAQEIPLVKDWFKKLSVNERVLCLSTVDAKISNSIKQSFSQLINITNNENGKFVLKLDKNKQTMQVTVAQKGQVDQTTTIGNPSQNWIIHMCNSKAYMSPPEQKVAELELIKKIKLKDTFSLLDTLTVAEDLVRDVDEFWRLATRIVGGNFAIQPHRVEWLSKECELESFAPLWFCMSEPNSIANWILYFLERALWIQFNNHVYAKYADLRDAQNNSLFLKTENRPFNLKEEIKPFWRSLCENPAQRHDANLPEQMKTRALIFFGIMPAPETSGKDDSKKKVDVFSGGLTMHESTAQPTGDQQPLIDKIAMQSQKLHDALENNQAVPFGFCNDYLTECTLAHSDEADNLKMISKRYNFWQRATNNPSRKADAQQVKHFEAFSRVVELRMDRVFHDVMREYMTKQLSSGFTSKNSKLLKKKQKRKLKKELEKEQQRELEAAKEKEDNPAGKIIMKSDNAIELLLVKQEEQDARTEKKENIADAILPVKKAVAQHTTMSEKKSRDQGQSTLDQTEQRQGDMFNYFQWRDRNPNSSQESTIKTGSTREESQIVKAPKATQVNINAMSNEEFLEQVRKSTEQIEGNDEKRNEGNSQMRNKDWQRKQEKTILNTDEEGYSEMVNQLIDDDANRQSRKAQLRQRDQNYKLIDVRVKQGKLHAHKDNLDDQSPDEKDKDASSSSSPSDSSDQDLLPDLFQKFEPQPHDNDSSDYGADAVDEEELDAELAEEDDLVADDDSSAALSKPQSSQIDTSPKKQTRFQDKDKDRKRLKKKPTTVFSSKKSIKSAHPKMKQHQHLKKDNPESEPQINFYQANETTNSNNVVEKEDKVAQKVGGKKRKPLNLPKLAAIYETINVQSAEYEQSYEEPPAAPKKKNKKKNKKKAEAVDEPEKKEVEEVKTIEIIKPQIEILRPAKQPAPPAGKKAKNQQQQQTQPKQATPAPVQQPKKKKKDAADAMNEFMKSLHASTATANTSKATAQPAGKDVAPSKQEEAVSKKKDDKKAASTTATSQPASNTAQAAANKFQKKPLVHQSNPEQRLSNVEEAQILGSGNYRYEVKSKKAEEEMKAEEKKAGKKSKEAKKQQQQQAQADTTTEIASEEIKPVFKEKKIKEAPPTTSAGAFGELKAAIDEEHKSAGKEPTSRSQKKKNKQVDQAEAQTSSVKQEEVKSTASKSSKPKRRPGRSEKSKKKKQFQQTYIDPNTGQSVVMDLSLMMQGAGATPQLGQPATGADLYPTLGANPQQFNQQMDMQAQAMQLAQMQMMQQQPNAAPFLGFQQPALGGMGQGPMNMPLNQQKPQTNLQQLLFNLSQSGLIQMAADQYKRQQQEQMALNQQMMEDVEPCPEEEPELYDAFYDLLEEEMKAKVKHIEELRDSVHKEREGLINLISVTVKETFASRSGSSYVGIKTFGSSATDLAIETSDVDLVVIGMNVGQSSSHDPKAQKEQLLRAMQKLYDCLVPLKDKGQVQSIQLIGTANVPIIKLVADLEVINQIQMEKALAKAKQEKLEERRKAKKAKGQHKNDDDEESKIVELDFWQLGIEAKQIDPKMRFLKVDISIDEQGQQQTTGKPGPGATRSHGGIETIYHIKELCRQRKDLRPIVMIIKKILDETYLSMPYHGGISSLSLVLMVSAYLKRYDEEQQEPLSANLAGFFHFYGTGFKPEIHYLDGDKIETSVNRQQRPFRDAALTIIDPMDRNNNVSHSSFNIHQIQMAFIKAYKIINVACLQFQRCGPVQDDSQADELMLQCQPRHVLENLIESIKDEYYKSSGFYDD